MSKVEDGGPAFPSRPPMARLTSGFDEPATFELVRSDFDGMSLRDWFAGQAISGVLSYGRGDLVQDWETANWNNCAMYAYELADAMLAARLPSPSK